jgi:hypothetical protein
MVAPPVFYVDSNYSNLIMFGKLAQLLSKHVLQCALKMKYRPLLVTAWLFRQDVCRGLGTPQSVQTATESTRQKCL